MGLKVTFFYNQGKQGFSETYYSASVSDPQSFLDGITPSIMHGFTDLRAVGCVLWAIRASYTEPPRRSALRLILGDYGGLLFGNADNLAPDVVSTDAVLRLSGLQGSPRRLYLRGLKDSDVVLSNIGNDQPTAQLVAGFKKLLKSITALNLAIKYTVLPPVGGAIWSAVTDVGISGIQAYYSYCELGNVVAWPAGFEVGSSVVFQGVPSRSLPRWPRVAQITGRTAVAPFRFSIAYRIPGGIVNAPTKMRVTPYVTNYDPILAYQFERFSEQKTGKPFGALRGRSRGVSRVA